MFQNIQIEIPESLQPSKIFHWMIGEIRKLFYNKVQINGKVEETIYCDIDLFDFSLV